MPRAGKAFSTSLASACDGRSRLVSCASGQQQQSPPAPPPSSPPRSPVKAADVAAVGLDESQVKPSDKVDADELLLLWMENWEGWVDVFPVHIEWSE